MTEKYWEEEIETMSRADLEKLQLERLKNTVEHAMNSPFYKKLYAEKGLSADSIKTLDDLKKFPFTTKDDLRSNYPYGFAAVPLEKIVRLHSSSGTTGNPTVVLHTKNDLDAWANQVARCMYMVGVRNTDVFQNTSGYGMFTGGLGYQYGAERLGCLTVPAAAGNSKRQIKFIRDFGTTVLHTIPSYATRLAEVFAEEGLDPKKDTNLRIMCVGAEPHSEEQRKRIEELLGLKAYNCFGMSEMNGPGVAFECPEQNGLHIWEDMVIVEIINPETLEPVKDGEVGEICYHNPYFRGYLNLPEKNASVFRNGYVRSGDMAKILPDGNLLILGRSDDMMIIRGVNVFPSQIETVLLSCEYQPNYLIEVDRVNYADTIDIYVEMLRDNMTDLELVLTMLSEASTKEISKSIKPEGFEQNKTVAKMGGSVAKNARKEIESKTGKSVISTKLIK